MTRVATDKARRLVPVLARLLVLALGSVALAGCGASAEPVGPAGVDELTIPTPDPDPADFSESASNPWFPLGEGMRWTYRLYSSTGHRAVDAAVLPGHRTVAGVPTTGVRWQVRTPSGERTVLVRWYAVDRAGDVWWFGQRVARHGPRLDRLAVRSWLAGRGGAEAGLVLSASPRVGDGYLNGYRPLVVARRSTVLSVDGTVSTVRTTYRHTVVTRDLSSLAPVHMVETFYARGLGMVAQEDTVSVSTSLALMSAHRP